MIRKLLTIPAFAWAYHWIVQWLDYLKSLPAWQAVMRRVHAIQLIASRITKAIKSWASVWRQRLKNWFVDK